MINVVLERDSGWVKQQRPSPVVFNAFTPYSAAHDIRHRNKQFFTADPDVLVQRVDSQVSPAAPTPPTQSSDIFSGQDTYGWPPEEPIFAPAQGLHIVRLTTYAPYSPATDLQRRYRQAYGWSEPDVFAKDWGYSDLIVDGVAQTVTVPNVVGLPIVNAQIDVAVAGLQSTFTSAFSPTVQIGYVVSSAPAAGSAVLWGSNVALVVSLGPAPPPPSPYFTLGQAIQILSDAGFTINPVIIWQYSATIPYYYIIGQIPTAGEVITYQSIPVQLTVSAGPAPASPTTTTVPSVVGEQLLDAMAAITDAQLNMGTVTYVQSATVGINSVIAQSVAGGSSVQLYTAVNLTVCSGPPYDNLMDDEYTVPNVTLN